MTTPKTVDIDAPIDHVWTALTDVPAWGDWMPGVRTARLRDGVAQGGPGAQYLLRQAMGEHEFTVTTAQGPQLWEITTRQAGADYRFRYSLTPSAPSGTRVVAELLSDNLIASAMNTAFDGSLGRQLGEEMAALKTRAKATALA